jgi:ribose transport system permease protein
MTFSAPVRRWWRLSEGVTLALLYGAMVAYFALRSPYFLRPDNLVNIGDSVAVVGLIGAVQTMVLVSGGLDLSVGSVVALTGVVVALLFERGTGWPLAVGAGLAVGAAVGVINGLFVTRLDVNPFITTLGTLSAARGYAFVLTGGHTNLITDPTFLWLGHERPLGVPCSLWLLAVVFLGVFLLMATTRFGRHLYAVGSSPEAARLSGVPVDRVRRTVYLLSGLAAALAGLVMAAQLKAAAPQSATGLELSVIAAVILGGTSLSGGQGSVLGTLIGVLILGTLDNGLVMLQVSSHYQQVARGAVLLGAVALDRLRRRWE